MQASAQSTGHKTTSIKGNFEDILFELSGAIVNKGFVIDYTGHVDSMLSRTSGAVGEKSPYKNAKYILFCSAKLTNAAVTADPSNMAICPYVIFAYETAADAGTVHVGYRRPIGAKSKASQTALAKIEELLDEIVQSAAK
jgi:uncharacterized protein (DUF302 family)